MIKDGRIGLVGYLIGIIISIAVTLIVVQTFVVEREQRGCNRRQPIFREIESAFHQAGLSIHPTNANATRLRHEMLMHAKAIDKRIVRNCAKAYPPIVPFVR
jgi:hypothetical protein